MAEDNSVQLTNGNGKDSWVMWQKIVLSDIERNSKDIEKIYELRNKDVKDFNDFKIEYTQTVTRLKTEAKIWAATASIISGAVALAIAELVINHH